MAKRKRRRTVTPKTLAEEAYGAVMSDLEFEDEPSMTGGDFMSAMVCLYGPPKIGKSSLAKLIRGAYFLPTEPGFSFLNIRKTRIKSWVDFIGWVKKMEKMPKKVRTVGMWIIDTGDNLSKFAMQYACGREEISHPTEEEWGKGWEAFRDEFNHWMLRLCALGPGVLVIAHETEREVEVRGRKIPKWTPSMPKTTYALVNALADITLHMSFDDSAIKKKTKRVHGKKIRPDEYANRCFYTKPTENRDAGDRTGLLPPKITFATEQEGLDKVMGYIDGTLVKGGKKKKKLRRKKKRT
jgi:hypothetical protein